MMHKKNALACAVFSVGIAMIMMVGGCNRTSSLPTDKQSPTSNSAVSEQKNSPSVLPVSSVATNAASQKESAVEGEHPHKAGSHGGVIVPIGSDSYHAEAVTEKSGDFRLLILGKDESRVQEVDLQTIKAYVKVVGQADASPIELTASRQEGDSEGKTSQFIGQLPQQAVGKALEVTIPNLRINGERFRIGFSTASAVHEEEMPVGLPADEERELYLTPGGKYTEADIEANGRMVASEKFKGIRSSHDMKPKQGDRICPVTLTKANPKFTWTIDGKPYEFCCPPCVDEFVKLAKEQPDEVKSPDTYIK